MRRLLLYVDRREALALAVFELEMRERGHPGQPERMEFARLDADEGADSLSLRGRRREPADTGLVSATSPGRAAGAAGSATTAAATTDIRSLFPVTTLPLSPNERAPSRRGGSETPSPHAMRYRVVT